MVFYQDGAWATAFDRKTMPGMLGRSIIIGRLDEGEDEGFDGI